MSGVRFSNSSPGLCSITFFKGMISLFTLIAAMKIASKSSSPSAFLLGWAGRRFLGRETRSTCLRMLRAS